MKTKEEEKRIIDSYNTIFQQIIKNRPEICGLVDDTDNYIKHLRASSQAGIKLGEKLISLGKNQESSDIEQVFTSFGTAFKEVEQKRDEIAKAMSSEIYTPLKKYLETDKKNLADLQQRIKKGSAEAKAKVKAAEDRTKKASKNPQDLQAALKQLNDLAAQTQDVHVRGLEKAICFQRGYYCSLAAHFSVVSAQYAAISTQESILGSKFLEDLKTLGNSVNKLPQEKQALLEKKQRTLIDIGNLSSDWKKVFHDAGVKKSDLRDAETAKFIIETIEKATGKKIDFPGLDSLDSYQDPTTDSSLFQASNGTPPPPPRGGNNPPPPPRGGNNPPPPPRRNNNPPPPPRGNTTARPAQGGGHPPPPRRSATLRSFGPDELGGIPPPPRSGSFTQDLSAIPAAPAAPAAPVAPAAPAAPAAPKFSTLPASSSSRGDLLSQIQQGTKLRKTEPAQAQLPDISNGDNTDLTTILRSAMMQRRSAVVDDEEVDDDDEWSD